MRNGTEGIPASSENAFAVAERAPVIEFSGVSKSYSRRLGRAFLGSHVLNWLHRTPHDVFYALKDVSFSIPRGESVAILGPNGAGKSTLLSLVAGISWPNAGKVKVNGKVAALLELGSGFHPDLTGIENVFLNASLLGFSRKRTEQLYESIVEFSGIRDFMSAPLRTYSTGMVMRLAFSVAVNVDPDILIIDEVLAVGDRDFQAKCIAKIHEFRDSGKTLLCVSHVASVVERLCDRALCLDHGRVVLEGPAVKVLAAYNAGVMP